MRRILYVAAIVACLSLTACDITEWLTRDDSGKSDAERIVADASAYIPNGPLRMVADLVLLAASIASGVVSRKKSASEHAATEAREYTDEEALSMQRAMDRVRSSLPGAKA